MGMTIPERITIGILKRQASREYRAYYRVLDELSCGAAIGEHISPRLLHHKINFNNALDELAKYDPTCPATRL
jgi:hypothetical protein